MKFAVAAAALAFAAAPTYAQRAGGIPQARDNAYLLAGQYSARGFYIQPAKSDICGAGSGGAASPASSGRPNTTVRCASS